MEEDTKPPDIIVVRIKEEPRNRCRTGYENGKRISNKQPNFIPINIVFFNASDFLEELKKDKEKWTKK